MATGSSETKENPSKDLMMKMTGPKSQSSSNVSSSPSTMYQTSNGGYQSLDDSMKETCHEYEGLEFRFSLCQSEKSKAKDPQSSFRKKFCSGQNNININWISICFGLISIVAITALLLNVLLLTGGIGPKCGCNRKQENAKQSHNLIWPNESTTFLLERIDVLEKNISSLVLQIRSLQSGGNGVSEGNISSSGSGGNGGKDYSSNTSSLTIEVQKLREKQVLLNSSLTKLKKSDKIKTKDIQEMKAKVAGLAVAVNFLSLNDSFINSKVHKSEVEFRSSIEALKQKDYVVDASIKRAKGVEAFLNSSVSQLNIRLDQMNTNIMAKIKSMNGTISGMQGGSAGLPGPPGPPGPRGIPGTPGAGNLSQCQHQQKEFSGVSGINVDYFVNYLEPKDKIVVGVSCSTVRGDETSLSSATNSRGEKVYLCTCRGQSNYARGSGITKCLIDVWVCPRIS